MFIKGERMDILTRVKLVTILGLFRLQHTNGCPFGWDFYYEGKCYKLVKEIVGVTTSTAQSRCNKFFGGGHLAKIETSEELDEIGLQIARRRRVTELWIGGAESLLWGRWNKETYTAAITKNDTRAKCIFPFKDSGSWSYSCIQNGTETYCVTDIRPDNITGASILGSCNSTELPHDRRLSLTNKLSTIKAVYYMSGLRTKHTRLSTYLCEVEIQSLDPTDWSMVFKAVTGVPFTTGLNDTWFSNATVNQDLPLHQLYYMGTDQKLNFKSNVINLWHQKRIEWVKLSLFKDGVEVFNLTFLTQNTNRKNWFKADFLIYPRLEHGIHFEAFTGLSTFLITNQNAVEGNCSMDSIFIVSDSRHCMNEAVPSFYFKDTDNQLKEADVFTISVIESCARGWYHYRGSCYKRFFKLANYWESSETCRLQGGHLLSVTSQFEYDAMIGSVLSPDNTKLVNSYWTGLNDIENEGDFGWQDGSKLDKYEVWATDEPYKNITTSENATYINNDTIVVDSNETNVDKDCVMFYSYNVRNETICCWSFMVYFSYPEWMTANCSEQHHFVCEYELENNNGTEGYITTQEPTTTELTTTGHVTTETSTSIPYKKNITLLPAIVWKPVKPIEYPVEEATGGAVFGAFGSALLIIVAVVIVLSDSQAFIRDFSRLKRNLKGCCDRRRHHKKKKKLLNKLFDNARENAEYGKASSDAVHLTMENGVKATVVYELRDPEESRTDFTKDPILSKLTSNANNIKTSDSNGASAIRLAKGESSSNNGNSNLKRRKATPNSNAQNGSMKMPGRANPSFIHSSLSLQSAAKSPMVQKDGQIPHMGQEISPQNSSESGIGSDQIDMEISDEQIMIHFKDPDDKGGDMVYYNQEIDHNPIPYPPEPPIDYETNEDETTSQENVTSQSTQNSQQDIAELKMALESTFRPQSRETSVKEGGDENDWNEWLR
ncbi:unnamed protein product [Owenia fusiformis]|uniref:C-type lectin domain-containing protein n=1 Tax=Owenia fusiformis TaxID=6347 RepID=A0A8S4Q8X9_OWEFU|nr:unnamed protein product [Owenia fusiformis]